MTDPVEPVPALSPAEVASPAIAAASPAEPPRRGFGITALVLGILLVLGVAAWVGISVGLLPVLVWLLLALIAVYLIIGVVHVVVALIAIVFGILAIVRDRGRVLGIVGLVLTVVATAAAALVAFYVLQAFGALGP